MFGVDVIRKFGVFGVLVATVCGAFWGFGYFCGDWDFESLVFGRLFGICGEFCVFWYLVCFVSFRGFCGVWGWYNTEIWLFSGFVVGLW